MKFFPIVCGQPMWRLWSQHAVIMLQGAIRWPTHHLPDKIHLPCGDHVVDAGYRVEHLSHFVIVKPLLPNIRH